MDKSPDRTLKFVVIVHRNIHTEREILYPVLHFPSMFHSSLITALNEEFTEDEIQRATLYVLLTMLSILYLMKGLCIYFSRFSPQQH